MYMRFCTCDAGSVTVNGKKIGKDIDVPENLGAIIETPGFLNNYSGYNNLKFLAGINKKKAGNRFVRPFRL